jgi:DNA-binding NarL/FixJ family response regulator
LGIPNITILLAEDFRPYRTFVVSLLGANPTFHVVCEASDGLEAVARAQELRPDVVLMDIGLPKLNGLEAARRIRRVAPSSKILFLTQVTDPDVVHEALSLGASGYIAKQQAGTELLMGLAAVLQGKHFVSSRLVGNEVGSRR